MARPINDFVQLARVKGPFGAAQADAEESVRQAFVELCERAGVWREEFEFLMQDGVPDYPIDVPEHTRLICISEADIGGTRYRASINSLMCRCGGWFVSVPDNKTVWIQPTPYPACETWTKLTVWVAPLPECCEFPDLLYAEYGETIAFGAASRLLQTPKQEYTNQGLANRCFNLFEAGITRAKNKRSLERTTGPLLMRGSYF